MTIQRWCALITAIVVLTPAAARAQGDGAPDLGANAALQYWQAFTSNADLTQEQEKAIEAWKSGPPPATVKELLSARAVAFTCLHRGSKHAQCDWGLHYEDGVGMLLPHIQRARTLARLASLRARASFEEGKPAEGAEDIVATLTLARHVGSDGTMISLLVQFAIETVAQDTAARYLPRLDAKTLRRLSAGLEKLPPGGNLRRTYQMEKKHMVGWIIKHLKESKDPQFLEKILAPEKIVPAVGSKEDAIEQLKALEVYYDEMDRIMTLPRARQDAEIARLNQKVENNAMAKLLLPALGKVTQADDKARTRWALFRAALAVAQGGPEKVKEHSDPFGDGPIEYVKHDKGFELKSKLIDSKGQPVTIRVGGN